MWKVYRSNETFMITELRLQYNHIHIANKV